MAYVVSQETALRVVALLDQYQTPARAAHEVGISLAAIRPYTDRRSEAVAAVLGKLARWDGAKLARNLETLRRIAGQPA